MLISVGGMAARGQGQQQPSRKCVRLCCSPRQASAGGVGL